MIVHGISHEEVERAIRLLALCSLGAQQSVLPYAMIATALKVETEMMQLLYHTESSLHHAISCRIQSRGVS